MCDTDAFATTVWHERYMGTRSDEVERVAEERRRPGSAIDLYLVTDVDIPFEQDGYRDGEHLRRWMHRRFLERLEETERPYLVLRGSREERVLAAEDAVKAALGRSSRYPATAGSCRRDRWDSPAVGYERVSATNALPNANAGPMSSPKPK